MRGTVGLLESVEGAAKLIGPQLSIDQQNILVLNIPSHSRCRERVSAGERERERERESCSTSAALCNEVVCSCPQFTDGAGWQIFQRWHI